MQRVIVVGPPGSGKTVTASAIAADLGAKHIELDALWWDADWTEAGPDVFRARAGSAVDQDRWVIDGNYLSLGARDVIWPMADTVVWLDQSRWVTIPRVTWRTCGRVLRRTDLWNGNRESIGKAFRRDSIVRYAWREHPNYKRLYECLAIDSTVAYLTWVRLRSPREVKLWLASIGPPEPQT